MPPWQISGKTALDIAGSVEFGVHGGQLGPGAMLPSVRSLAARLGVSPATVASAYRDLKLRGLVATHTGRGTTIAARPPLTTPVRTVDIGPGVRDISQGNPDVALLPDLAGPLRQISAEQITYGSPTIDPAMLELARDWFDDVLNGRPAADSGLCLSGGALDGIERILRTRTRPSDEVLVEDPCYSGVLDLVRGMGLKPIGCAIDDEGPVLAELERSLERGVSTVILTPRAQNPTGAALSAERARAIRRLMRRYPTVHVIENDYLAELSGVPYEGLSGGRRSWTVIRSFSKALGPDLRVAVVAGDSLTVSRVHGHQQLGTAWVSHLLQRLVVQIWNDPGTPALLRQAERTYRERREGLIAALAERGVAAFGRSGLNVIVPLAEEGPALQTLRTAGWYVRAGERHRLEAPPFIRITSATLDRHDAQVFAADLAAVLTPDGMSHPA